MNIGVGRCLEITSPRLLISQRRRTRPTALLWTPHVVNSTAGKVNLTLQPGFGIPGLEQDFSHTEWCFGFAALSEPHSQFKGQLRIYTVLLWSLPHLGASGNLKVRERGSALVITECLPCNGFVWELTFSYTLLPSSGHNMHQPYSLEQHI